MHLGESDKLCKLGTLCEAGILCGVNTLSKVVTVRKMGTLFEVCTLHLPQGVPIFDLVRVARLWTLQIATTSRNNG